jgi:hypothetical protein
MLKIVRWDDEDAIAKIHCACVITSALMKVVSSDVRL